MSNELMSNELEEGGLIERLLENERTEELIPSKRKKKAERKTEREMERKMESKPTTSSPTNCDRATIK